MNVNLNITTIKKENCWIANCSSIKTFGYSKESEIDAIKDCVDAIKIFFDVHTERNSLEKALNELTQ